MTRTVFVAVALGLLSLRLAAGDEPGARRPGSTDVDALLAEARTSGKLVLLCIGSPGCGPCEAQKVALRSPEFVPLLARFHVGYLSEGDGSNSALVSERRVSIFPTLLVLRSDGAEEDRAVGWFDASDARAFLGRVLRGADTLTDLRARHQRAPDDFATGLLLAQKLVWGSPAEALSVFVTLTPPGPPQAREVTRGTARAEAALGHHERAIALLEGLLRGPGAPEDQESIALAMSESLTASADRPRESVSLLLSARAATSGNPALAAQIDALLPQLYVHAAGRMLVMSLHSLPREMAVERCAFALEHALELEDVAAFLRESQGALGSLEWQGRWLLARIAAGHQDHATAITLGAEAIAAAPEDQRTPMQRLVDSWRVLVSPAPKVR